VHIFRSVGYNRYRDKNMKLFTNRKDYTRNLFFFTLLSCLHFIMLLCLYFVFVLPFVLSFHLSSHVSFLHLGIFSFLFSSFLIYHWVLLFKRFSLNKKLDLSVLFLYLFINFQSRPPVCFTRRRLLALRFLICEHKITKKF
jgi:hypothetical protein